ncbi:hypothetical protein [Flavivirga eckloniae]|uniref:PKD domain-containing protein n=1 Tax=Flavivirga eckloniae TaxID=1803846 RepID=A0A2K9PKB9_9FLAO|nr:hypothetical protein [Flavivirga eckloniae]AUP77494.1 hypothetical protein C1H87_01650 [Flavivirga eckloniae]
MKTNIKSLSLKAAVLCLFFICSGFFIEQTAFNEAPSDNKLTDSCTGYFIYSIFDTTHQGSSMNFHIYDGNGHYADNSQYDWTLRDMDGNTIKEYYNQTPYFSMPFNVSPGSYIVSGAYHGSGSCYGSVYKTITVTP